MKKMFCVFETEHNPFRATPRMRQSSMWVLNKEGVATRKWDGTCCRFFDGKMWARFEYKEGRTKEIPLGAVLCEGSKEVEEITGKLNYWVPIDAPGYKYHKETFLGTPLEFFEEGATYELVGEKVNGNRDCITGHCFKKHGDVIYPEELFNFSSEQELFNSIKDFLSKENIEGLVFHHKCENEKMAKITKRHFLLNWG